MKTNKILYILQDRNNTASQLHYGSFKRASVAYARLNKNSVTSYRLVTRKVV